jgi:hypothetical protein
VIYPGKAAQAAFPTRTKETMMKQLYSVLMLAGGLLLAPLGQATVINFDNGLSAGAKLSTMNNPARNPYAGFTWDKDWFLGDTTVNGYGNAAHSGNQFLSNGFGVNNLEITSTSAFNFQGAWFATPNTNGSKATWVKIDAYNQANQLIGSSGQVAINALFSFVNASFTDVWRLNITRDKGWFVMDDFTLGRAGVPEPTGALLFSIGLAALAWRRQRARVN